MKHFTLFLFSSSARVNRYCFALLVPIPWKWPKNTKADPKLNGDIVLAVSSNTFPHLHVSPQISGFSQQRRSHFENFIHCSNSQVPQSCIVPPLSGLAYWQTPFVRFSSTSAIGKGHMHEQLGVWEFLSRQRLQGYMSITRLEALQRYCILTCCGGEITYALISWLLRRSCGTHK